MSDLNAEIERNVTAAFAEDLASGDLTAAFVPERDHASAILLARGDAVLCGRAWFDACFTRLDTEIEINWRANDGETIIPNQTLCEIEGRARAILSGERSALNFVQTLSATATATRRYVEAVRGTKAVIMDTRKTLPGLRAAQKYAVRTGGGQNQRIGLYDGILIKENHIALGRNIGDVLARTQKAQVPVQIEVETLAQLKEALAAGARLVLLDNFTLSDLRAAVALNAGRAQLEASGGITLANVRAVAETGVDRISIGSLTKDVSAVDLSLRIRRMRSED